MNRTYRKFNFPAFPVAPYCGDRENPPVKSNTGMSIRAFFASSALAGISATEDATNPAQAAKLAFELADAMMEELNEA
jgi:hypothetical protein